MHASPDFDVRTVATLGHCEVYRGQVFHAGRLWEGHSHGRFDEYRLDAHDADGTRVIASARVPHTLEHLYPFGADAILVVGKHHTGRRGWRTYHSVVRLHGGRLTVRTRTMPAHLQVEQFGGRPGEMYFNETGSRRVFRWNGLRAVPFEHDILMPGAILVLPGCLFVMERARIVPGMENVVRIDLLSGGIARTFNSPRRGLARLVDLAGFRWIAAVESLADQVLLIDKWTNTLAAVLPVAGSPVDAAQVGRHLLVVSRDALRLRFFDLATDGVPLVADWDLAAVGNDFTNVTTMHADPVTGNVFLRSPFHPDAPNNTPCVKMLSPRTW